MRKKITTVVKPRDLLITVQKYRAASGLGTVLVVLSDAKVPHRYKYY